jgi:hypothetical protein
MTQTAIEKLTRSETFDCDGPAELQLRVAVGRIEVRLADVPRVRVDVMVEPADSPWWEKGVEGLAGLVSAGSYAPAEADAHALDETQITFSERRRRLVVRTPRSFRRIALAVVVEAPRGSALTAALHRGTLTASGPLASLKVATGSGAVSAADVAGPVDVASGSGDIKLGRVVGELRARTGSGEIEVASVEGDRVRLATGSGDVWLGAVRSDAHVRTGSGGLTVAEAGAGSLDLVTGSGDVHVGIRSGVAAELDVVSGSGRARSELDPTDKPTPGAPVVRVKARTGSGEAVVSGAIS